MSYFYLFSVQRLGLTLNPKLLPGESESEFQASLEGLLSELEKPSPLNVALVIQLNECLWWIKRHTVDKELILHESMTSILAWIWRRSDTYDNHQMSSVLEDYFAGNTSKYYKGVSVN